MSVAGSTPMNADPERDAVIRALLRAVRGFGDAHDQMSLGLKGDMDMNASDVAALRMLIIAEDAGRIVTPADIARHLQISTASTTKLIDRLSRSGHLERRPHPSDRRALSVHLTQKAREDFWRLFGARLRRMAVAADAFSSDELVAASRVFEAMAAAIAAED